MATVNNPSSTILKIYTGGTLVALAKLNDCSLTVGAATRDITTKDSAGWAEKLPALKNWSMKGGGLLDYGPAANANMNLLLTALTGGTAISVAIGTGVSGDMKISGSCFATSWELGSPGVEANTTIGFSLEGTAAITVATYP